MADAETCTPSVRGERAAAFSRGRARMSGRSEITVSKRFLGQCLGRTARQLVHIEGGGSAFVLLDCSPLLSNIFSIVVLLDHDPWCVDADRHCREQGSLLVRNEPCPAATGTYHLRRAV